MKGAVEVKSLKVRLRVVLLWGRARLLWAYRSVRGFYQQGGE